MRKNRMRLCYIFRKICLKSIFTNFLNKFFVIFLKNFSKFFEYFSKPFQKVCPPRKNSWLRPWFMLYSFIKYGIYLQSVALSLIKLFKQFRESKILESSRYRISCRESDINASAPNFYITTNRKITRGC